MAVAEGGDAATDAAIYEGETTAGTTRGTEAVSATAREGAVVDETETGAANEWPSSGRSTSECSLEKATWA
jgi:hypothetical protein